MSFNKFGSVKEYVRQVYEVNRDGSFSGTTYMGIGAHLALILSCIVWLLTEDGEGAGMVFAGVGAINLFFNLIPFVSQGYGEGEKKNF